MAEVQPKNDLPVINGDDEQTMLPEHDFYRYFGQVIANVFTYFRRELKWYQKCPKIFCKLSLPEFFDETNQIIEKYIEVWKTMKTYTDGRICFHVYKMFYSLLRDPQYQQLPKYEKNILLWSTLLHDICKRGPPVIQGKDPIHPFKGAWLSLYYFNDVFKFVNLSKSDFEEWDEIYKEAYLNVNDKEVQNHIIVPKVKEFIDKKLKGNDFVIKVLYYVLLHQSIPTLKDHPHASMLEPLESEVPKYFNKRMFKAFRILLIHDSFSYLLFSPDTRALFGKEIDANVQLLEKHVPETHI